jgi:hypothetical protein
MSRARSSSTRARSRRRRWTLDVKRRPFVPILLLLAACRVDPPRANPQPPSGGDPPAKVDDTKSLALDKQQLRNKGASAELITRIESSAFRYFRMLGPSFQARTCSAFNDIRWHLPLMVVHGDAHIEQFVVTRQTYGLEDFDRAGFGPAVVDLVRYAASIHVACRQVSWACSSDAVVARYLDSYRSALDSAPTKATDPAIAQRLRAKAPQATGPWLTWADSLATPLSASDEANARRCWQDFSLELAETRGDRAPTEYEVVRVGALSMGLGSAMETKVLFRIQGPTSSADDDYLVEAREGAAPEESSCVWRGSHDQSLLLTFMSVLGRRLPDIFGFVPLRGDRSREFWLQSWDPGYQELSLMDVANQAELEELAIDAASQLGGHFWTHLPERLRPYHRYAQLKAFDLTRARVVKLARELADESMAGWQRFRSSS